MRNGLRRGPVRDLLAWGAAHRFGPGFHYLVGSMLAITMLGVYLLEAKERRIFAQGRLIASLHRQVDQLFHRYLSPDVADVLLHYPDRAELSGEVVEATVLFADLTGFTPFAERSDPGAVVEMLNDVYGAAVPAVFDEGGTIIQFMGDALMAVFNAPVRQPDHALRAALAARALQNAVSDLQLDTGERPQSDPESVYVRSSGTIGGMGGFDPSIDVPQLAEISPTLEGQPRATTNRATIRGRVACAGRSMPLRLCLGTYRGIVAACAHPSLSLAAPMPAIVPHGRTDLDPASWSKPCPRRIAGLSAP